MSLLREMISPQELMFLQITEIYLLKILLRNWILWCGSPWKYNLQITNHMMYFKSTSKILPRKMYYVFFCHPQTCYAFMALYMVDSV